MHCIPGLFYICGNSGRFDIQDTGKPSDLI